MTTANTHLEHIQDYVFTDLPLALQIIKSLNNPTPHNKLRIGIKYDGSPSLVFGINPENNKFFLGTKSVFNKTPKINYSTFDIFKNHSKSKGLCDILVYVFSILENQKDKIDGIYQCDLMYTPDMIQDMQNGVGVCVGDLEFTPNTITYSVNNYSGDNLIDTIRQSLLGIAIHTKYTSLTNPSPIFLFEEPKFSDDIYQFPVYNTVNKYHLENYIYGHITNPAGNIDMDVYTEFKESEYSSLIKIYENYIIRTCNTMLVDDSMVTFNTDGFLNWVIERRCTAMKTYKTASAKLKQNNMIKTDIEFLTRKDVNVMLRLLLKTRSEMKPIIDGLNREASHYSLFNMTIDDNKTCHEGLVVSCTDANNNEQWRFKAVRRLEFSKANFQNQTHKK